MTKLTTLLTETAGLFGFRWLDNIRGRWLGRIGGILGKFTEHQQTFTRGRCSLTWWAFFGRIDGKAELEAGGVMTQIFNVSEPMQANGKSTCWYTGE